MPADGFSARFTRNASFEAGTYRFTVTGDDGLRLYVDGALRLDRWLDQAPTTYSVDVALSAGSHAVRLDYYENAGGAVAKLAWAKTGGGGGTSGSKLTLHTGFTGGLSMAFVRDAKPRLLKILDNFGPAAEVKALSPGTLIVGRIYEAEPDQVTATRRRERRSGGTRNRDKILGHPAVDYWEGYNEPDASTVERIAWYAQFEAARVGLLAANGQQGLHRELLHGHPGRDEPFGLARLLPRHRRGARAGGDPRRPRIRHADAAVLRRRDGRRLALRPLPQGLSAVPDSRRAAACSLAITEAGVDGVAPVGWKNHFTGDQYLAQLKWYDSLMRADSYVLGATIFSLEIPGWDAFDIGTDCRTSDRIRSQHALTGGEAWAWLASSEALRPAAPRCTREPLVRRGR